MHTKCCLVLVQKLHQRNSDSQHSDINSQGSVDVRDDNHTEVTITKNHATEDSIQHSSNDDSVEDKTWRDVDSYYMATGPTEWAELEVKPLGRQKPQDQSSTNEVLSYHIDLSAYYASSQTVSTSNLFIIIVTLCLTICCQLTAH